MKSFYLTDSGKVRDHNEDSVIIVRNRNNEYLMAVADGMGGHSAGEVASSIAIGYLGKHFNDTFQNLSKQEARRPAGPQLRQRDYPALCREGRGAGDLFLPAGAAVGRRLAGGRHDLCPGPGSDDAAGYPAAGHSQRGELYGRHLRRGRLCLRRGYPRRGPQLRRGGAPDRAGAGAPGRAVL